MSFPVEPSLTVRSASVISPAAGYGFWARTALLFLAAWPAGMACAVVYWGAAPFVAELTAVLALALLFLAAGLLCGPVPASSIFSRWQLCLIAVIAGAYVISTVLAAVKPAVAARYGIIDLILAFGAVGAFLLLRNIGEHVIRRMLQALVLSGTIYIALYIWAFADFVQHADGSVVHSFFPFVNVRRFTNILAPITAISLALWAVADHRQRGWPYLCAATLFVSFLIWSGGRAPTLAVVLAVCGISMCAKRLVRIRMVGGLLVAFAVGSLTNLWLPQPDANFAFWVRIFSEERVSSAAAFSSNRFWLWEQTFLMIWEHPWLGHGYRQWVFQRPDFVYHGSAHNFPLQIVFDLGLIGGGSALVLAFGTWLARIRLVGKGTSLYLVSLTGLSVMMIQSFADGIFSGRPSLQLAFFLFSLSAAAREWDLQLTTASLGTDKGR